MIRVTIEMVPWGFGKGQHMATIEIANDVEETLASGGSFGSYTAKVGKISQQGKLAAEMGTYRKIPRVTHINRNKSGAVYRILQGILNDFFDESTGPTGGK